MATLQASLLQVPEPTSVADPTAQLSAQLADELANETDEGRRVQLIAAQLELGWPYALHIAPADLETLRKHQRPDAPGLRVLLGVSAVGSFLWNGLLTLLAQFLMTAGTTSNVSMGVAAVGLGVGTAHAVACMVVAFRRPTPRTRRWLMGLGFMFVAGPLFAACSGQMDAAMRVAIPAMVTASLALFAGLTMRDKGAAVLAR